MLCSTDRPEFTCDDMSFHLDEGLDAKSALQCWVQEEMGCQAMEVWVNFRGDECMFHFFLSPESAPVDVASIQNQPAREWTDRLIQKGVLLKCMLCGVSSSHITQMLKHRGLWQASIWARHRNHQQKQQEAQQEAQKRQNGRSGACYVKLHIQKPRNQWQTSKTWRSSDKAQDENTCLVLCFCMNLLFHEAKTRQA